MIALVCGPPGAGKSTFATTRAAPGDMVIDLDRIRATGASETTAKRIRALMEEQARSYAGGDVWIVRTLANPIDRADYVDEHGVDRVHTLDPGEAVCKSRVFDRDGNTDRFEGIERWQRLNPAEHHNLMEETTMTDTNTTEPSQTTTEQPGNRPQEPANTTGKENTAGADSEAPKGNREAAKYRTRLREVEAERDQLAKYVTALRQSQVETIAREDKLIVEPKALWAVGLDVNTVLAEDGSIDRTRAVEAVRATAKQYGMTPPPPSFPADFGGMPKFDGEPAGWEGSFEV